MSRVVRLAVLALCALAGALAGASAAAQTITEYARECAEKVAPIPAFSCQAGERVPITVDGRTPAAYTPQMRCDRPSLLTPSGDERTDGQCVPHSRALVLRDDDRAQISVFCRQKIIRPADTTLYDEIDIVAHNVRSGSTCWFQASAPLPLRADRGVDGRRVLPPTEPAARGFWNPPARTAQQQCVRCHDSGPFMYSPFIAQTKALPGDPFGPYVNDIGAAFRAWPQPFAISTRGNTCTACHRIGNMNSCQVAMHQSTGALPTPGLDDWGRRFPQSHWMSPGDLHTRAQWEEAFQRSVDRLAQCCKNPHGPGCTVAPLHGQPSARR